MSRKRVVVYVDLPPGWQDDKNFYPCFSIHPSPNGVFNGWKRARVIIDLPECPVEVTETVYPVSTPDIVEGA